MNTTITINEKSVVVHKFTLCRMSKMLKPLRTVAGELTKLKADSSKEAFLSLFLGLIESNVDKAAEIINAITDVDTKEITEEWGIADLTEVIRVFFEVNDYQVIQENIKVIRAALQTGEKQQETATETPPTPSTNS